MVISSKLRDTLIQTQVSPIDGTVLVEGDYVIKSVQKVTKLVKSQIPYVTGGYEYGEELPPYLTGFEKYYTRVHYTWATHYYELKKEYEKTRPYYSIEVTYDEYDVEFTETGKAKMKQRYIQHKRLMEKYGAICEELEEE